MPLRSPAPPSAPVVGASATAILVLGMHRSGTSAIARMLNLCGAELGRDLLPAKADNERGFWENKAILALHEQLLATLHLRWHDIATLPDSWRSSPVARAFVAALTALLGDEFAASRLFAAKDPRLSLLAPLWIEALQARHVRPAFVITVRHPDEVAASLFKRDGISFAQSRLLWLQHFIEAERATRGQPRVFVHYERVLADWRTQLDRIAAELQVSWPARKPASDQAIDAFIAPGLRHHQGASGAGEDALPPLVRHAYQLACDAATGSVPTLEAFAAVGRAFDAALELTGPVVADLSSRMERERAAHVSEIDLARTTIAGKDAEIANARAATGELTTQIAHAREAIDSLAAQIDQARTAHQSRDQTESELRQTLEALSAEIEHARDAFTLKEQEIVSARANIDVLASQLDQARAGFTVKEQEIGEARRSIDALLAEIGAARRTIDSLLAEIGSAREVIALKDREIEAARSTIDALSNDLATARSNLSARAGEIEAARANIDALAAQIEQARAGFAAKDAELDAARTNINALVAEIQGARQAHQQRDIVEAGLRNELSLLHRSRWFQLGRRLRVLKGPQP